MTEHQGHRAGEQLIRAVLQGGPADLPAELRVRMETEPVDKIKIEYLAGYEHFERTGEAEDTVGSGSVVFQWITRTKFAE